MALEKQALVLDFGGVISRTLFETHEVTEKALKLEPGTLTWRGPFAIETDPLWASMQADQISEREYWNLRATEVSGLFGESWTMDEFVRRARGDDMASVVRPEAVQAIEAAERAGKRLAILSNELDLFYGKGFTKRFPLLKKFEVVIDATYTGVLKPDRRAYELCIEALKLQSSQCIFVDDQKRNIDGAAAAGMITVHFDVREPKKSYEEALSKLGVPEAALTP